ncbi:MAG: L-histidine N(alpha)-methyltransferase [Bacteroidota bacterium]
MVEIFKKDVEEGLSSSPKRLSSKYFYDEIGDDLFVQIMNLPEYYLTNSEYEIFQTQGLGLIQSFGFSTENYFELVELGAGDGSKTMELLKILLDLEYNFSYLPIDISQNALNGLEEKLTSQLPDLDIKPRQGDYFRVLRKINASHHPKVVLFLGSNIGNMTDEQANEFIRHLSENLEENDKLVLGVDLIKSRNIVFPAYNDKTGVTREFNFNLLRRINKELGGNFVVENYEHAPEYFEEEGIARSYLISKTDQTVTIEALNKSFSFAKGEKMLLEVSRKYNDNIIQQIVENTGFVISKKFVDRKNYFADYVLEKIQ